VIDFRENIAENFAYHIQEFRLSKLFIYAPEKNGKTLHLLKSGSKPTQAGRKRKKIPVLGSLTEYKDQKKKAENQSLLRQDSGSSLMRPPDQPQKKGKDAKMKD